MDPAQLTSLGIVVLAILAGVVVLASARRNQSGQAMGALSRETRAREVGSGRDASQREGQPSAAGREQVGEKKGGPAPRGMDRFPMTVSGGVLTVDTGTIIPGPTIGTNTTGQEAEGRHCVGSTGGGH